ncbi:hypothetical protein pipiens_000223 [Culex pipiens pipiens]|uniref:Fibrinogen C-terminal domain-containing protein n=1 Tax=Culex pipiens pipiens TaxID=38569 RepID=A0ABD1DET4_CULPP
MTSHHLGMKFSTFDNDNDLWSENCAVARYGAWWYSACAASNLNGRYTKGIDLTGIASNPNTTVQAISSNLPRTCSLSTNRHSGIQLIHPQPGFREPFEVFCDQEYENGGWIVIQNRYEGSVHFYRDWDEYERGFGNLGGEFWLGLSKIHELTYSRKYELHVVLEDWDGIQAIARYSEFLLAGPKEKYLLRNLGTEPFGVFCDQEYEGGGWIVIQNRFNGSVHFYRDWNDYERGFGNLNGEFWLGLSKIHELTYSRRYELLVLLEDWEGVQAVARYSDFLVAGPKEKYMLRSLGNFSGSAGDSLMEYHLAT